MLLTLLPFLTVVANLAIVLVILLGVSQRVRQLRARAGKNEKALETETARLAAEIAGLKDRLAETERELADMERAPSSAAPVSIPAAGVNNTLRSKVLKMHRLGQSADRIAGSLRLPKGEVDLLVKVHQIVMRPYEEVVLSPLGVETAEKV
jgi:hypothetical protein